MDTRNPCLEAQDILDKAVAEKEYLHLAALADALIGLCNGLLVKEMIVAHGRVRRVEKMAEEYFVAPAMRKYFESIDKLKGDK